MPARLIYDGLTCETPPEMGSPAEGQMAGGAMDQLHELCGRVSYDSLGRGRKSQDFHQNLRDQGHYSVYRHGTLTFGVDLARASWPADHLWAFVNRPGVHVTGFEHFYLTFTCNLQSALQWKGVKVLNPAATEAVDCLGALVQDAFARAAPHSCGFERKDLPPGARLVCPEFRILKPETDEETYASIFVYDVSRVVADELLRHTWQCAPSMESTRYVDMSRRPWVAHPLLLTEGKEYDWCRKVFTDIQTHCRAAYNGLMNTLQMLYPGKSIKQLRGAARGIIAMSTATRLVFTGSLKSWKHFFALRIHEAADEEMQWLAKDIRKVLAARWPERFDEKGD